MLPFANAQPPVILISIDTLRADHLGTYGYRKIATPNIDSFARHGTVYTRADAQVPLTLPSHTVLFTSTFPFQNRIEENAEPLAPGAVTLASVLRSHGYQTAAFVSSVFLEAEMGLDQGFQIYDSPFHYTALSPISGSMFFGDTTHNPNAGRDRRVAALTVRAAEQWLNAHRNEPAFAFVHLYDLHKPYEVVRGFTPSPHASSYDAQIEYVDQILGGFRDFLVKAGWWDRSVVVLLSDHGEGLGEHGEANHGYFVYESTLWVPLIIHWPASASSQPARVAETAGLIDVAPTILDLLHLSKPESFEGVSLLHGEGAHFVYAESLHSHDSFGWAPLRSLRAGAFKYIEAPHEELYNLETDPHEQHNLIHVDGKRARELHAELSRLLASHPPQNSALTRPLTDKARALLQSLGYLAPGPTSAVGSGIDPKDGLPEFQLYESATDDIFEHHLAQAISKLRSIVAHDTKNTLARRDLGACYLADHQYAPARAELGRVASAVPTDYMTQYELGVADEHLGLIQEAAAHLEIACKLAPDAVECTRELEAVKKKQ